MSVQLIADKLSAVHLETSTTPIDLNAPFQSDKILEVRRGKLKPLPGLTVISGIDKSLCDEPVFVGSGGIVDDEHDYTFHGGPEKAVHGCKNHAWYRGCHALLTETKTAPPIIRPGPRSSPTRRRGFDRAGSARTSSSRT